MKYFYQYLFFICILILFLCDFKTNNNVLIETLETDKKETDNLNSNSNSNPSHPTSFSSFLTPATSQQTQDFSYLCNLPKCYDSFGDKKPVCCHDLPPCQSGDKPPYKDCDVICCHPPWLTF